jgi:predicted acylesterase/phospholipase RssA
VTGSLTLKELTSVVANLAVTTNNRDTSNPPATEIHLLLSGGGYRATLFHLGVLRYLFETRLEGSDSKSALASVSHIVGVSGGSITAAHFAANFERYTQAFDEAANDLLSFTSTVDLRRDVLKKRRRAADVLGEHLLNRDDRRLFSDLPPSPRLTILGTDLVSGRCVSFSNNCVTVHRRATGEGSDDEDKILWDGSLLLADAVHASSAFPPFFPPLRLRQGTFKNEIPAERFRAQCGECDVSDGGIRDNLGIDWYSGAIDPGAGSLVIVSDAGQVFDHVSTSNDPDTVSDWLSRLLRATDIQMMRLSQLDLSKQNAPLVRVGFDDRFDASVALLDTEDLHVVLQERVLPKGLAATIAGFPTDLVPVPAAFRYGLVRLGYDLSKKIGLRRNAEPNAISRARFWRHLWDEKTAATSLANGGGSLKQAMDRLKPSQIPGASDALGYLPISRRMWRLIYAIVCVVGLLTIVGTRSVVIFVWPHISRVVWPVGPRYYSYSEFLNAVNSRRWDDVGEKGAIYELRGQLYSRRENIVTIFLDRLDQKKLAEIAFDSLSEVQSLPTNATPGAEKYLIVEGTLSATEPSTWHLKHGRLKSQLYDERPRGWDSEK